MKEERWNQTWWDEFKGRCVACQYGHQIDKWFMCNNEQAHERGMHKHLVGSGGVWNGDAVHKMFGCVYFESAERRK